MWHLTMYINLGINICNMQYVRIPCREVSVDLWVIKLGYTAFSQAMAI